MPRRSYSYREGDRSEYLALYLLSALGLVAPIPRQEDIGYDFVCSVADRKGNDLTFADQYLVSVKSESKASINLVPSKDWKNDDDRHHMSWFFRLDLPLILAVVSKDRGSVALYATTGAWHHFDEWCHECGALHLVPRVRSKGAEPVAKPKKGKALTGFPKLFEFTADLGDPFLVIRNEDTRNDASIKKMRNRLRFALLIDRRNRNYHRIGVPLFAFPTHTNDNSEPVYSVNQSPLRGPRGVTSAMHEIAPILASMAMFFRDIGNTTLMNIVGAVLRINPSSLEDVTKENLKDLLEGPTQE